VSAAHSSPRLSPSRYTLLPLYTDDLLCFQAILDLSLLFHDLLANHYLIFLRAVINSRARQPSFLCLAPAARPSEKRPPGERLSPPWRSAAEPAVAIGPGRGLPTRNRPRRAGVGKRATADTSPDGRRSRPKQPSRPTAASGLPGQATERRKALFRSKPEKKANRTLLNPAESRVVIRSRMKKVRLTLTPNASLPAGIRGT